MSMITIEKQKELLISAKKLEANKLLQPTDWYVTRKAETGVAIPQDVVDARAAIKADVNSFETSINAATTMEGVWEVVKQIADAKKPTPSQEQIDANLARIRKIQELKNN